MATSNWSVEGGGVTLDKKTLKVTTYNGAVNLTAEPFSSSGANAIDASSATHAITLQAGTKATTITTGTVGATVISGAAGDKISLGTGSDVVQYAAGSTGNNDVISGYSKNDTINITDKANSSLATFTDKGSGVTVTFNGSKSKLTVNKKIATDPINFKFGDTSFTYGSIPGSSKLESNNTKLTVGSNVTGTVNASNINSLIKTIDATGDQNKIYIVGNGQANIISLSGAGGTIDGGYAYDATKDANKAYKATADKLYGNSGTDTFVVNSSLSGNDAIYNYNSEQGDLIYVSDMNAASIASVVNDSKKFKTSKTNVAITFDKSKLTIDGNPKQIFFVDSTNNTVAYGPALPSGTYVDANKTTLYVTSGTSKALSLEYSVADAEFNSSYTANNITYANANFAPKLKAIDASTFAGTIILGASDSSIAATYKAGTGSTTLIGGKNNDVLQGNAAGSDTFIYSLDGTVGGGKDQITGFGGIAGGDIIKLDGFDSSTHALTLTAKSGKSFTIAITNKSSNKSLGQIIVNENPNDKKIIIVDGENNVIGTNPITTPKGLVYDEKKGITTDKDYTGAYVDGSYIIGDPMTRNASTGKYETISHSNAAATINASDYNAKLTTINASVVNSTVTEVLLEGNANVKNILTAPNDASLLVTKDGNGNAAAVITTTLKGSTSQPDVLNGSTLNGSTDYFYVTPSDKAKKDTFYNYDEGDVIVIQHTDNVNNLNFDNNDKIKFDDKSADAVLTLDKTTITLKDGAGKAVTLKLVDSEGEEETTTTIGHLLPTGLKYDAKKVTIAVKPGSTTEAADVGGDNSQLGLAYGDNDSTNPTNKGYISLDLNAVDTQGDAYYFSTVKEINLKNINDKVPTQDNVTKIADNSVHVTLLGNSQANTFTAGGNASSTTIFYGGKGDLNKPESDKFYGGAGKDVFIYELGDGKDQISESKGTAATKFSSNDVIVLGTGGDSILAKDDIYVTDNGAVVTIQIGTDTKKGTLVVYKDDSNTPLTLVRTKDSSTAIAVASSIASGDIILTENGSGDDYEVYNYGLKNETLVSSQINGKTLTITGLGDGVSLESDDEDAPAHFEAKINLKEISSAVTGVGVTAGSDVSVYVVGNNNNNTFTLGAGGGTVDGAYSRDAKGKVKATADKYYGGSGSDVFAYVTLTAAGADGKSADVGGKDIVYNYDPDYDAIYVGNLSNIKSLKYADKNVAFTFAGATEKSKNNVLTIQGINGNQNTLPADTQITFLVDSVSGEDTVTAAKTYTYFDKKNTTDISQLTEVINPWSAYITYKDDAAVAWTTDDPIDRLSVWHYTGNSWTNNNLDFTIKNISDHYGDTVATGHIDIDKKVSGVRPVGVEVEEPHGNIIKVTTVKENKGAGAATKGVVDFTDFSFGSVVSGGANGVHILGLTPSYDSLGIYNSEQVVTIAGDKGQYRLADLDGDASNGYELLKTNRYWDLTKDNRWYYGRDAGSFQFTVNAGTRLDTRDFEDNLESLPSDYNDKHAGSPVQFFVDGKKMTVESGITSKMLTFAGNVDTNEKGIHIYGFDTDTTFTLTQTETSITGSGASAKSTTVTVDNAFVLAELDNDSSNGFELLRKNDLWKLTPDGWNYSSATTKGKLTFSVGLVAPTIVATDKGAPEGISVEYHPSIKAADGTRTTLTNQDMGLIVDFDGLKNSISSVFEDTLLTFGSTTPVGKTGVHIKNLSTKQGSNYSSQVKVGDAAYWLVNLDNDRTADTYVKFADSYTNGLELAKVNDTWSPVYDNSDVQAWAYSDTQVQFTITSGSVTVDSKGANPGEVVYRGFDINTNGAVENISVNDSMGIEVKEALTANKTGVTIGTKTNQTLSAILPIENITFASTTSTGAAGIHLKGYASDTTLYVGDPTATSKTNNFQLVNLDNDTTNGYELMAINSHWSMKGGIWTYFGGTKGETLTASDDNSNITFRINTESGLSATDDGQASGITVDGSTITFDPIATSTKVLNAITFDTFKKGTADGATHVKGLAEDTQLTFVSKRDSLGNPIASTTSKYQLVNLDGNASNGLELMKVDSEWTLKNGVWSFANGSNSIAFSIDANAGIAAATDGSGIPVSAGDGAVKYYADPNSKATSLTISKANFAATDLTISKASVTGAKGLHFVLPTTHDAEGALAPDTKYTIEGVEYQLVELDGDTDNGYELMKVDDKWSLADGNWTYSNDNLAFTVGTVKKKDSTTAKLDATDSGIAKGVTVSADGTNITLSNDIVDLDGFKLTKATYGTGSNAVHIYGEGLTAGNDTITIGDATQKYRLIDLDSNTKNGYELMKVDEDWTYHPVAEKNNNAVITLPAGSWTYSKTYSVRDENDNSIYKTLSLTISSTTSTRPTAEGVPSNTTVNTSGNNMIISVPGDVVSVAGGKITLSGATPGTINTKYNRATHIKIDGLKEGTTIKSDAVNKFGVSYYSLYDADGVSDNGFELTYNGWLPSSVNAGNGVKDPAFKYKSSTAEFVVSGSAFVNHEAEYDSDARSFDARYKGYTYSNLDADHVTVGSSITLKGTAWNTGSNEFHVSGTDLSANSTLKVNNVTFSLENLDNNDNNGYELRNTVNGGWSKATGSGDSADTFTNKSYAFTLVGGVDEETYDNAPDGLTFSSGTASAILNTLTFTGKLGKSGKGLGDIQIIAPSSWDSSDVARVVVSGEGGGTYELDIDDTHENDNVSSKTYFKINTTKLSQLPANDGWVSEDYEIDELLDYESPTSIVDDEFDEIMEIKPLASDSTSDFNVSTMFDGVSDRTISALALAAKQRKQK